VAETFIGKLDSSPFVERNHPSATWSTIIFEIAGHANTAW
jgi:hypothetical protein